MREEKIWRSLNSEDSVIHRNFSPEFTKCMKCSLRAHLTFVRQRGLDIPHNSVTEEVTKTLPSPNPSLLFVERTEPSTYLSRSVLSPITKLFWGTWSCVEVAFLFVNTWHLTQNLIYSLFESKSVWPCNK